MTAPSGRVPLYYNGTRSMPFNMKSLSCFKAYDVRGLVPEELNENVVYRIGRAYAAFVEPKKVAVGYDIRLSSYSLSQALISGLTDSGVDVIDIGIGGSELSYFATFHENIDGGIMVTASHNPPDYNGLKFVREESQPISSDTGLEEIRILAEKNQFPITNRKGLVTKKDVKPDYIQHLLSYVSTPDLSPLKIVVNAGNGGAGPILDLLEPHLPFEFFKMHHEPDGAFPNGVPNPLLEKNRGETIRHVQKTGANLGLAWDGDYDRCFFFDEDGRFIDGYYIVGLLAQTFLRKSPGERIVHDPRLTWNTLDIVKKEGGQALQSKSGHAFIKQTMREKDAIYGGEMSAHHYFRDFSYADSGMIPWLLVTEIMSQQNVPLSALVSERMEFFPASGEINRKVEDVETTINRIKSLYIENALNIDHADGVSIEFTDWRFNLRASNTEPVVRLNVESNGNMELMQQRTDELLRALGGKSV